MIGGLQSRPTPAGATAPRAKPVPPAFQGLQTPKASAPQFPARTIPTRSADNSRNRLSTSILAVYLFLLMSRGVELISEFTGANLRVTLILAITLALAALFSGGLMRIVRSPVGLMFGVLTGWLCLTCITSQWRGGSAHTMIAFWLPSSVPVLLIPSLVSTVDQCRKAMYALAFSLVAMLFMTFAFQADVLGRDETSFGTLGNPNDLAFSLLLVVPFAVVVIKTESLFSWKTILAAFAIAYATLKILRTGSRAGMLAVLVVFAIVFAFGKLKTKFKMLAFAGAVIVGALTFVPSRVLMRYATVGETTAAANMSSDEVSAVESAQARKMLFQESLRMMFTHPLLGVGPGLFSAALANKESAAGHRGLGWHEAHNSFTQLGSEAGIPALALYLALVIYCLQRTLSIFRRTRSDPRHALLSRMASCLAIALVIFVVCAFFGNYAYMFHFAVLAGLSQALDLVARKELAPAAAPRTASKPVEPQREQLRVAKAPPQVQTYVRHRRLRDTRI